MAEFTSKWLDFSPRTAQYPSAKSAKRTGSGASGAGGTPGTSPPIRSQEKSEPSGTTEALPPTGSEGYWPPPDAEDLLEQWKAVDRPRIPLSPGISIVDLERWFSPLCSMPAREPEALETVREFLLGYVLSEEEEEARSVGASLKATPIKEPVPVGMQLELLGKEMAPGLQT